jgi:hypothetical protein
MKKSAKRKTAKQIRLGRYNINMSNRSFYSLITLGILILLGAGILVVDAVVDKTGAWHDAGQIDGLGSLAAKNSIAWNEITSIPTGFADGTDDAGSATTSLPWTSITGIPAGFSDGVDNGDGDYCAGGVCSGNLQVKNTLKIGNRPDNEGFSTNNAFAIELLTENAFGGVHDRHTGIRMFAYDMDGWGTAKLGIQVGNGWGTYDSTPAMVIGNDKVQIRGELNVNGGTINTPGRLHISGGELLYLLNKNGVVVGKEWGGNGNLQVEGDLYIGGAVHTRICRCDTEDDRARYQYGPEGSSCGGGYPAPIYSADCRQ